MRRNAGRRSTPSPLNDGLQTRPSQRHGWNGTNGTGRCSCRFPAAPPRSFVVSASPTATPGPPLQCPAGWSGCVSGSHSVSRNAGRAAAPRHYCTPWSCGSACQTGRSAMGRRAVSSPPFSPKDLPRWRSWPFGCRPRAPSSTGSPGRRRLRGGP